NSISFVEWMKMDLDYIDNWSIGLDVKIIFKTIGVIFKADGQ
ncbi:sugar transferase, partial [bacterium]|nr:sugar transferase [bacterium]